MSDTAPTDRFLTLQQVADRLNVSVRYVRTLRQSRGYRAAYEFTNCANAALEQPTTHRLHFADTGIAVVVASATGHSRVTGPDRPAP